MVHVSSVVPSGKTSPASSRLAASRSLPAPGCGVLLLAAPAPTSPPVSRKETMWLFARFRWCARWPSPPDFECAACMAQGHSQQCRGAARAALGCQRCLDGPVYIARCDRSAHLLPPLAPSCDGVEPRWSQQQQQAHPQRGARHVRLLRLRRV